jgi:hypothetical protein
MVFPIEVGGGQFHDVRLRVAQAPQKLVICPDFRMAPAFNDPQVFFKRVRSGCCEQAVSTITRPPNRDMNLSGAFWSVEPTANGANSPSFSSWSRVSVANSAMREGDRMFHLTKFEDHFPPDFSKISFSQAEIRALGQVRRGKCFVEFFVQAQGSGVILRQGSPRRLRSS